MTPNQKGITYVYQNAIDGNSPLRGFLDLTRVLHVSIRQNFDTKLFFSDLGKHTR